MGSMVRLASGGMLSGHQPTVWLEQAGQTLSEYRGSHKMPAKSVAQDAAAQPTPKGRGGSHGLGRGSYAHLADRAALEAAAQAEAYFLSVVKFALQVRGLEYAEVAPALGIGVGTLADKLNGRSNVSVGEAAQLAYVIGLPLAHLVDRTTPISELMAIQGQPRPA